MLLLTHESHFTWILLALMEDTQYSMKMLAFQGGRNVLLSKVLNSYVHLNLWISYIIRSSLQKVINLETTHIILLYSFEENMDLRSVKVFYYNSKNRFVNLEAQLLYEFVS